MAFSDRSTHIEKADHVTINQSPDEYKRRPALIARVIKNLSMLPSVEEPISLRSLSSYNIEAKLDHNRVFKYRSLVEEYGEYGQNVIKSLNTVEQIKIGSEQKILKTINGFYKELIGDLKKNHEITRQEIDFIDYIRIHSDQIIESVINKISQVVNRSSNGCEMEEEDLILGAKYVVAHAFIECKVLERPAKC